MKIFCLFLFFLSSIQMLNAQLQASDQIRNDSLLNILNDNTADSVKARAAFHLSKLWINLDSTKGLTYLHQGKTFSKKNKFLNAIYRYQSIPSYSDEQEVNAILAIFNRYNHVDSWDYVYRVIINRVRWLINQQRTAEAIALLKKEIVPLINKLKNPRYYAEVNLEMGRAFYNQGLKKEAVTYYEKAVNLYESSQPKDQFILYDHIHTLGSLANVYNILNIANKADSVIRRAKVLLQKQPNLYQELRITSFEAMYYIQNKQYKTAENIIQHTLSKAKGTPPRYLLNLQFQQYKARAGIGDYRAALALLKQSHPLDSIAIDRKKFNNIDLSELLPEYALAHERIGDYKQASHYWQSYINYRDSISKDQIAEQISKLEVQLRTQEKDAALRNLETERSEIVLHLKNQRILNGLFATMTILLLTVSGFILYIYRSKQKNNIKQIETDHKLEVTKALLEGEERERQRIGRDLHDSLGGALAGIRIQLSETQQQQSDPILDRAIVQLENSISEVRRIARNMVPESLLCSGLDTALQDLCVAFSSVVVNIEYQSSGLSASIPITTQTNIYRIVQELLVNALSHGKAMNIIVQCIQNENTLLLTVEDDGLGFRIQDTQLKPGIGLKNIQHRVEYMQGNYHIESELGQGTTINIEIHVK